MLRFQGNLMNYRKLWEYVNRNLRWYENPLLHITDLSSNECLIKKGEKRFNKFKDLLIKNRIKGKPILSLFTKNGKLYGRNLNKVDGVVYQFNERTKKLERYL